MIWDAMTYMWRRCNNIFMLVCLCDDTVRIRYGKPHVTSLSFRNHIVASPKQ